MNIYFFKIALILGFLSAVLLTKLAYDQSVALWHKQGFAFARNQKEKERVQKYWKSKRKEMDSTGPKVVALITVINILLSMAIGKDYSMIAIFVNSLLLICFFLLTAFFVDGKIRKKAK